mmetsp:Transcript_5731/g.21771  ORF Transcript_5731/g.21771 Transcript_5731/m.21771 type:complete len:348 (-) Transcript_5731:4-1047(-)
MSVGPRFTVPPREPPMMRKTRSTSAWPTSRSSHCHVRPSSSNEPTISPSCSPKLASKKGGCSILAEARRPSGEEVATCRPSAKNRRHCGAASARSFSRSSKRPSSRASGAIPETCRTAICFQHQNINEPNIEASSRGGGLKKREDWPLTAACHIAATRNFARAAPRAPPPPPALSPLLLLLLLLPPPPPLLLFELSVALLSVLPAAALLLTAPSVGASALPLAEGSVAKALGVPTTSTADPPVEQRHGSNDNRRPNAGAAPGVGVLPSGGQARHDTWRTAASFGTCAATEEEATDLGPTADKHLQVGAVMPAQRTARTQRRSNRGQRQSIEQARNGRRPSGYMLKPT